MRLRQLIRRFRECDAGFLTSTDYMLSVVIITLGAIVGIASLRDTMIQDMGDVAISMESLSQNYTVSMTFASVGGGTTTKSFGFTSDTATADNGTGTEDGTTAGTGEAPGDIEFNVAPDNE